MNSLKQMNRSKKKKRVSDSETFIYSVDLFFFFSSLCVVVVLRAYASIFGYCRETQKEVYFIAKVKVSMSCGTGKKEIDRVKPIEIPTARKMKHSLVHCKKCYFSFLRSSQSDQRKITKCYANEGRKKNELKTRAHGKTRLYELEEKKKAIEIIRKRSPHK